MGMEMMASLLDLAVRLPWAREALWLEFGVANGRSLGFIAAQLQRLLPEVMVHGFDSFEGIQQSWNGKTVQSFSMSGEPPPFLKAFSNVQLHAGYFGETLKDLDAFRLAQTPVALAHVDVDLFSSAREVLGYLKCQLFPGSILIFDEWFNYPGWNRDGEYRAWQAFAAETGLRWRPASLFF